LTNNNNNNNNNGFTGPPQINNYHRYNSNDLLNHNNSYLLPLNRLELREHYYFDKIIEIENCDICFETNQLGFEFNCCSNKYICIDCISNWILSNYNSYYELFEIHKNTKHLIKKVDCPFCRKKIHLDKIYSNKVEYKSFIQQFIYQLEKQLRDEIIIIQNKFKEQLNF